MLFNESDCLTFDPFEGDFGDGETQLENKIVTAKKPRACSMCGEQIEKGTRIRVMAEVYDGKIHRYSWCNKCCHAMAISWDDDGIEVEKRMEMKEIL